MSTACKWAALLTMFAALTGCASQNYDFASVTNGSARITQLADDLDQVAADESTDEEDLYEISIVPLMHSQLHVFSEADEDDGPAKFIEAEIESYLPLFAFVNGEFSQYDENRRLINRHEFESNLWGAFRKEIKLVVTPEGNRERTRHTIFWIFSWWGDERRISDETLSQSFTP